MLILPGGGVVQNELGGFSCAVQRSNPVFTAVYLPSLHVQQYVLQPCMYSSTVDVVC